MPAIDYTGQSSAYRARRTLPPELLETWRVAVEPHVRGAGRILDLGAGTGQFLAPLAAWAGGASVVAVEPSPAMRAELVASVDGLVIAGRGEALPLRDTSVDVAWLSTVVHQLDDPAVALAELRRVLRPGGRVLLRGYLADRARRARSTCSRA